MYFVGVNVGTGSARAGVFDVHGALKGVAKRPTITYRNDADHAEQSSAQVWQAVCESVAEAVEASAVSPQDIAGIGFDASCSLVAQGLGLAACRIPTGTSSLVRPPRHGAGGQDKRHRPSRSPICGRRHLARDASAQVALAKGKLRRGFCRYPPFLRLDRLPDMEGQRVHRTVHLHRDLQVDISRP